MTLTPDQYSELMWAAEGDKVDNFEVVQASDWEADNGGKYQNKTVVYKDGNKYFSVGDYRTGSYYTEWTYGSDSGTEHLVPEEVELVTIVRQDFQAITTEPTNTKEKLAARLEEAKEQEKLAVNRRRILEEQLAALLELPEDGQETHNLGEFKTTIKREIKYKINQDKWNEVKHKVDPMYWPVKETTSPDKRKINKMQELDPKMYALIAPAFEASYGKVSVTVKRVENNQ